MAAESATAAVYLGIPSHQPRSEHDSEQNHLFEVLISFSGEEPICHQGLSRLPGGRPYERLCLELS